MWGAQHETMLGSADRDAFCSLSILLGNHRNALSCAVKPLSLLLPDKYAPCMVPTVPSPKELLSQNWGLSRPRGKIISLFSY